MNVSDAHISRRRSGPASVAGSDYEAYYDGVVEDRFYNHAKYITLSSDQKNELQLKHKYKGCMKIAGARGMIEEAMASASVKMNRRNTIKPSSL
jgi:hypothetical protein